MELELAEERKEYSGIGYAARWGRHNRPMGLWAQKYLGP